MSRYHPSAYTFRTAARMLRTTHFCTGAPLNVCQNWYRLLACSMAFAKTDLPFAQQELRQAHAYRSMMITAGYAKTVEEN